MCLQVTVGITIVLFPITYKCLFMHIYINIFAQLIYKKCMCIEITKTCHSITFKFFN